MLPYLIAGAIGFGIGKLFENGGETFMAGGRITTNEDVLNSFLTFSLSFVIMYFCSLSFMTSSFILYIVII